MRMAWETLASSGMLLLVLVPFGRYLYVRFYLSKRLFFEPWVNLSRNEDLSVGGALAELLFFELERIRKLLEDATSDSARLWNDKSAIPALERSFEGYPEFVRHTGSLGLPDKLASGLRLILLAKPQAIRGSIQQFGTSVRFQVALEGIRRPKDQLAVRCWAAIVEAQEPKRIPEAISEIAHNIVLDFGRIKGFKSPQTFLYFTSGLQHHLAFNTLRRPLFLQEAEKCYRLAIEHEGGNAEASYNLGDLLYSQFTYDANEAAIEAYLGALQTDKVVVRARAFRGLANAYSQRCQRHRRDQHASIEAALRWGRFAGDFCTHSSPLSREDQASIKKAEAYAQQVWAEQNWLNPGESEKAFQKSVGLYKEAIDLNNDFTAAYNNVSYMYLRKAEKLLDATRLFERQLVDEDREVLVSNLREAERWCGDAIKTDQTFHLAYDNRGNIAKMSATLKDNRSPEFQDGLLFAIEWYHRALSYQPSYIEAHSDLAKAHASLFNAFGPGPLVSQSSQEQVHHGTLAWHHHWEALKSTSDTSGRFSLCMEFKKLRRNTALDDVIDRVSEDQLERGHLVACNCLSMGETL